jgi:hypothetical protein
MEMKYNHRFVYKKIIYYWLEFGVSEFSYQKPG